MATYRIKRFSLQEGSWTPPLPDSSNQRDLRHRELNKENRVSSINRGTGIAIMSGLGAALGSKIGGKLFKGKGTAKLVGAGVGALGAGLAGKKVGDLFKVDLRKSYDEDQESISKINDLLNDPEVVKLREKAKRQIKDAERLTPKGLIAYMEQLFGYGIDTVTYTVDKDPSKETLSVRAKRDKVTLFINDADEMDEYQIGSMLDHFAGSTVEELFGLGNYTATSKKKGSWVIEWINCKADEREVQIVDFLMCMAESGRNNINILTR